MSTGNRILKILYYSLGAFVFARLVRTLHAFLRKLQHRAKLLRELPGPPLIENEGYLGHFNGGLLLDKNARFDGDELFNRLMESFVRIANDPTMCDGLFRVYALHSSVPLNTIALIIVTDIDHVRQILAAKNSESFVKGDTYIAARPLIGNGVLATSGEKWAVQRPVLERGMRHEILSKMMPRITNTVLELVNKIKKFGEKRVIDVHEEMLKLTMDVIGRVAFGFDFDSVPKEHTKDALLYDAFDNILLALAKRGANPIHLVTAGVPFLERNINFNRHMKKLNDAVDTIIDKRTELRKSIETKQPPADLLDFLIEAMESGEMERKIVIDNIKTLLFAGHDTTAAALSWFIHLLSQHPESVKKIREEVNSIIGTDRNTYPTYDQLEKMEYLNACMLEVFRLYPSAGFTRNANQDIHVGKYTIPSGVEVMILPYLIHRDPKNYPYKPNEFVPDRWLDEGAESQYWNPPNHIHHEGGRQDSVQSKLSRYGMIRPLLPFSLGQRNCVGRPLSLAEIRTAIILILRNFSLQPLSAKGETDPEFREIPKLTLTLNPTSIKVEFVPLD